MAITTASEIITRAMIKIGVISPGESIPYSKGNQMLQELNDMLERWSLQKLLLKYAVEESFNLSVGVGSYTYGTGGLFNSAPPIDILSGSYIRDGSEDYPVEVKPINVYRGVGDKSNQGKPNFIAFSPEYPLGKVYVWPVPDAAYGLHLRVTKQLISFATLATSVNLPTGYRGAIVANLAIEICPNFDRSPSDALVSSAGEGIRVIKNNNNKEENRMKTDLRKMVSRGSSCSINNLS